MASNYEFEDFLSKCSAAREIEDLEHIFGDMLKSEGFGNHVFTTVGDRCVKNIVWHEFPDGYPEAYISQAWYRDDPILRWSLRARLPFRWVDVTDPRRLRQSEKRFMAISEDFKVRDGITFPLHGPNARCDLISISQREKYHTDPARMPFLRTAVTQIWCRHVELSGEPVFDLSADIELTPKQRDVLLWIKDGKSNSDIAEIMNVSVKTIEFHVGSILDRLGASNRISAVVIGMQRGLL